ncbi:MAG: nicotinate-nucleotide--dimethylbenzimidazole phosphoribosyltransferase [Alphaproteobacteria bacterium]|jgi:nicotinate-nucleotide--dimethylbenzimidazole phosphoribosyltransferase|nr:nicotinate-nucleotide--dimethylbenzimidazole phosphoribosyltransferase [Alphaproteobacteria bacterium]
MRIPVIQSLNDIQDALQSLPEGDAAAAVKAAEREPQLTKPAGSLGRLEDISQWLSRWQGRHPPTMGAPRAQVFAGNHGVVKQGVSAFPADVTAQMVGNFEAGGAAVNQLCNAFGVGFSIDALALDRPTGDFTQTAAMTEPECVDAFVFGMGTVTDGTDVLCLGEMGIGNTTTAAALSMALYGGEAKAWTGAGTGVEGPALDKKTAVVAKAVAHHQDAASQPLQLLCRLGGRELAAIAGAVLAARYRGVPVLLDGYVSTAAAAPLEAACPGALDHCRAGHVSTEPGHRRLLDNLGMTPLLDLDMRLGEASGAVLAVAILRAAVACHTGMATFAEAAVSDKTK